MSVFNQPWKLVWNKFVRYPGGREIDRFRGIEPACDDGRPEAWVGSDTSVANPPPGNPYEGRARVILPDGQEMYLFEAIALDPEAVLGKKHMSVSGKKLGVLVKLLDAQHQLQLQCHPSRENAKRYFNSDFGKAESWYIIGMRDDTEEPPYVYMGFKEGVTKEVFGAAYDMDDVSKMEACCHKVPVRIGDVFNIVPGLPHAVGAGCFLVEVQEPSDITIGWSKLKLRGAIPTKMQELHREILLDCYDYDGADYEKNLEKYRTEPKTIREGDWGAEKIMIGPEQTPYFSFTTLEAKAPAEILTRDFATVAIVLSGSGKLVWKGGSMEVKKADELFFPASVEGLSVEPGKEGFSIVLCKPPGVEY